jgi:dTDP-4-dehydrorhamnose reductase
MAIDRPVLLVLGANGQVGWELMRALAPLGLVVGATPDGELGYPLDLTRPETLAHLMGRVRPTVVVNAAAHTAVDRAEQERELSAAINAEAVGELGRLAAGGGFPLVHYSTDFVFSGDTDRPYREDDETGPLSVYGETKLAGERALAASGAPYLIFRTSWVYGVRGRNFLLTMLRLGREREELTVVGDQIGAPTWSRMLAETTAQVLGQLLAGCRRIDEVGGIYHVSAAGRTSWHGFARAIMERAGLPCRLTAIPTSGYPTPARRPANSVLDNGKLLETFGLAQPDWHVSLGRCMDDLGYPAAR